MAEDIKKVPEELSEEVLEAISGGKTDENGNWICCYCLAVVPPANCQNHVINECKKSPVYKGKR